MARTPGPRQAAATPTPAQAGTAAGWRALRQLGDNPLQAAFGVAVVALLIFALTSTNDRISSTNDRISRLEASIDARFVQIDARFVQIDARFVQIDARFAQIDARFSALEEDVAEINLKLTALIAALNKTDDVDAALEGRIIGRSEDEP